MTRLQRKARRKLKVLSLPRSRSFFWERPYRACREDCDCKGCRTASELIEQLRREEPDREKTVRASSVAGKTNHHAETEADAARVTMRASGGEDVKKTDEAFATTDPTQTRTEDVAPNVNRQGMTERVTIGNGGWAVQHDRTGPPIR